MTALHTYSYIVVDTQRGCHTLKKEEKVLEGEVQRPVAVEGLKEWKKRRANFETHSSTPLINF